MRFSGVKAFLAIDCLFSFLVLVVHPPRPVRAAKRERASYDTSPAFCCHTASRWKVGSTRYSVAPRFVAFGLRARSLLAGRVENKIDVKNEMIPNI